MLSAALAFPITRAERQTSNCACAIYSIPASMQRTLGSERDHYNIVMSIDLCFICPWIIVNHTEM